MANKLQNVENGKYSERNLEAAWKIAASTFKKMQMLQPAKYERLRGEDAEAQEIKNIFEKTVLNLPEVNVEKVEEETPVQPPVEETPTTETEELPGIEPELGGMKEEEMSIPGETPETETKEEPIIPEEISEMDVEGIEKPEESKLNAEEKATEKVVDDKNLEPERTKEQR
jgi:hypothetical protein